MALPLALLADPSSTSEPESRLRLPSSDPTRLHGWVPGVSPDSDSPSGALSVTVALPGPPAQPALARFSKAGTFLESFGMRLFVAALLCLLVVWMCLMSTGNITFMVAACVVVLALQRLHTAVIGWNTRVRVSDVTDVTNTKSSNQHTLLSCADSATWATFGKTKRSHGSRNDMDYGAA